MEGVAENLPPVEPASPPQPRRNRRWWLWALIVIPVFLFVTARGTSIILNRQAASHLEEVKAHLSFKLIPAKELPTLWGPAPKPEDNAAPLYAEIDNKIGELLGNTDKNPAAKARSKELEDLEGVWGLRQPDKPKKGGPAIPPRDPVRAHDFLDQFAGVFMLCDEAALRSGYRTNIDWSDLDVRPNYPRMIVLARLLTLRSVVAAEAGLWDEAYADMVTLGARARQLDQEKSTFLQCLVAIVIRKDMERPLSSMIHQHPPSASQVAALRRVLTTDAKGQLRDILVSGCICMNENIDKLLSGTMAKYSTRSARGFERYYLVEDQANYLETMNHFVRVAEMPWDRARADLDAMEENLAKSPSWLHPFSSVSFRSFPTLMKKFYLSHTRTDMLLIALNLAAYRQEHGKYPAALADLPNAAKLPHDPYTETGSGGPENEQPFHYRLVGEGFVLWSVGPEGKDGAETTLESLHVLLSVPPKAWEAAKP